MKTFWEKYIATVNRTTPASKICKKIKAIDRKLAHIRFSIILWDSHDLIKRQGIQSFADHFQLVSNFSNYNEFLPIYK